MEVSLSFTEALCPGAEFSSLLCYENIDNMKHVYENYLISQYKCEYLWIMPEYFDESVI